MGRAKTTNKFIEKEKKRNSAYKMKKETLVKKAYELSVLCDVPTCVIIYPFAPNNKSSLQQSPEVFTFTKGEVIKGAKPVSDSDPSKARELITRYLEVPKDVRDKVSRKLSDVVNNDDYEKSLVINEEKEKEELVSFNTDVSAFSVDQLIQLLGYLDYKLELVRRNIDLIKGVTVTNPMLMGDFGNNNVNKFDDQVLNSGLEPLGFNGNNFEFQGGVPMVSGGGGYGGAYGMSYVGPNYYEQGLGFGDYGDHMNMGLIQCASSMNNNAMLPDFSSIPRFY